MSIDVLKAIPEEEVWLASRKSARTRRAYRVDVAHFMRTFNISSPEELRKIDHRAVMAWERLMREEEGKEASTVCRRLAALSSLFTHLVKFGIVEVNPVRDVERPAVNRREGMTPAFSQKQARAILDAPNPEKLLGLRDRAILSVGLQVGFRRAEIAALKVADFQMNRGLDALWVVRKGGKKGHLAIHPQAAQRIREYLEAAKHGDDLDGPLFRPVRGNREGQDERRHLNPVMIDRVLRKYAKAAVGLTRGYSAHSMRATFITTALENGAGLEDVQLAAGHADPSTTKLYDRRGYNPEKSASFFANY
jgi:site-specific recombinase XerD